MSWTIDPKDSFEDMFDSFVIGAPLFKVMADRLLATDADNRPEYDVFRSVLRGKCFDALDKAETGTPYIDPLLARMDELLEAVRDTKSPLPLKQLRARAQKLTLEIGSAAQSITNMAEGTLRAICILHKLEEGEKLMAERGLSFPPYDTWLFDRTSAAHTKLAGLQKDFEARIKPLYDEIVPHVTRRIAEDNRIGWQSVFNYIAHGDPDSPGMAAPPRAQFKKRPAPKV